MNSKILIRADDVGYSRAVNYGIADSVWNGIIRSVGVMPNMENVQHGIDLLKGSNVCYGQHTNLCLGKPCADPDKIRSLLDENGNLKSSKMYREAWKNHTEFTIFEEVVIEVEAQYHRYTELMGEKPHYFEAHAVMSNHLTRALEVVAQKYNLPLLTMNEKRQAVFKNTTMQVSMDSMEPNYNPFESLKRAIQQNDCITMFVCHPGYIDDFLLSSSSLVKPRIQEVAMLTAPETKQWLTANHVNIVSYDELT